MTEEEAVPTVPLVEFVLDDENASVPVYSSPGAACMDLFPCHEGEIPAGEQALVDTGIIFAIPKNWEGKIRSRSGLAVKYRLTVTTGTIDSDYRGRVHVVLFNGGKSPFKFKKDMRVAQMKIAWAPQAVLIRKKKEELSGTKRGSGGFGSTGLQATV